MKNLMLLFTFIFVFSNCSEAKKETTAAPIVENSNPIKLQVSDEIDTNWTNKIVKSNDEWKKILTKEQYYITREQGTEQAFSSELYQNHEPGIFVCVCCNNPLFSSETKFESGTGWPSYFAPYSTKSVSVSVDNSLGMSRDEISCKRCDAHLGHVFNDGPQPTGLRYCMDGVALKFIKSSSQSKLKKATFAAGCFWCEEATFERVIGVKDVISGYSGGKSPNPTYEEVGSGKTDHAESFEFEYDPGQISYLNLLKVFFASQDPTQVNGQGPDHGRQYRSIIFYRNEDEKKIADDYILELNKSGKYSKPIATEVVPYTKFWKAEEYHQDYIKNHPEDPYVQQESFPRLNRTKSRVPEFFAK